MKKRICLPILILLLVTQCTGYSQIFYLDDDGNKFSNIYENDKSEQIYFAYLKNDWEQYVGHSSRNEFTLNYCFSIINSSKLWNNRIKSLNLTYKDKNGMVVPLSKIVCRYWGKDEYGYDSVVEMSFEDIDPMLRFANNKIKKAIYFLYPKSVIEKHEELFLNLKMVIIVKGKEVNFSLDKKIQRHKERLTILDDLQNGI